MFWSGSREQFTHSFCRLKTTSLSLPCWWSQLRSPPDTDVRFGGGFSCCPSHRITSAGFMIGIIIVPSCVVRCCDQWCAVLLWSVVVCFWSVVVWQCCGQWCGVGIVVMLWSVVVRCCVVVSGVVVLWSVVWSVVSLCCGQWWYSVVVSGGVVWLVAVRC